MKNLRKVLALVLAVVMTVSTFTVAFAAEEKTSAQILNALGFVVGDETGDLMEDKTITRAEAAQIIVKIMNWDLESADSYTFEDATWAKQQAATLFKKGITKGVGENKFGGKKEMTALEVYAWAYAAITGDVTTSAWANPDVLTKILTADQVAAVVASRTTSAKRSEIFNGMKTILTTEVEGKTQLDRLIEAGVVAEAKAIELGLKQAPVVENKIVSATLLNYKEVKVVFTVEASDDKAHYTVTDNTAKAVSVSEDKKTAVITLGTKVGAQKEVKIAFNNGTLKEEVKAAGIIDSTVPTVANIETSNKNVITLEFTEPIEVAPTVKINDGRVYGNVKANGENKFDVTINNATPGTTYKFEVSGAKDYAGLVMADATLNHTYEELKENITVSVKKAHTNYIQLELSRATEKAVSKANFTYILNKEVVEAKVEGKIVTLTFYDEVKKEGYAAPKGDWVLTIKKADEMFVDSWGNKPATAEIKVPFTIAIDEVAPTVKSVTLNQDKEELYVEFDEEVVNADTPDNYEIKNKDDKTVSGIIKSVSKDTKDAKKYILKVDNKLFNTETYTLIIKKKITDESKNPLADDVKMPFEAKYKQPLELQKAEAIRKEAGKADTNKIYVTFSSNMPVSAIDTSKWVVTNGTDVIEIKSVEFEDGSRKVIVITTADFVMGTAKVTTSALVDELGNKITDAVLSAEKVVAFADGSKVDVKANAIARDKIEITVDGRVNTSTIDITKIKIDGVQAEAGIVLTEKDGKTIITLLLDNKLDADLGTVAELSVEGLKLSTGVEITGKTTIEIVDKIKPELKSAVATLNSTTATGTATLTLTFTEDVKLNDVAASYFESELVLTYADKALVAGTDYTVAVTGNDVVTINVSKTVTENTEIKVQLAADSKYVVDGLVTKNALAAFEKTIKITK